MKLFNAIAAAAVIGTSFIAAAPAEATDKSWYRELALEICNRYERGEKANEDTISLATATVSLGDYARAQRALEGMDKTEIGLELLQ